MTSPTQHDLTLAEAVREAAAKICRQLAGTRGSPYLMEASEAIHNMDLSALLAAHIHPTPQDATSQMDTTKDCSPFLTQCPRCNNPNGPRCDQGKADGDNVQQARDMVESFVDLCFQCARYERPSTDWIPAAEKLAIALSDAQDVQRSATGGAGENLWHVATQFTGKGALCVWSRDLEGGFFDGDVHLVRWPPITKYEKCFETGYLLSLERTLPYSHGARVESAPSATAFEGLAGEPVAQKPNACGHCGAPTARQFLCDGCYDASASRRTQHG
jgi:hypothetical protein